MVTWKQLNVIYILLKPECSTPRGRQRPVVIHPCWRTAWFGIQEHRTNRQSRGGAHPVQTRTAEDWSARTDNEDRLHTEERWTWRVCSRLVVQTMEYQSKEQKVRQTQLVSSSK